MFIYLDEAFYVFKVGGKPSLLKSLVTNTLTIVIITFTFIIALICKRGLFIFWNEYMKYIM